MIQLGQKQTLRIMKEVEFGVYLSAVEDVEQARNGYDKEMDSILLPKKQIPEGARVGEEIEVFVYRDSKDRMIASTNEPKLTLHQVGKLVVKEVGNIGAFLDWGLEKDLLMPFKEQTKRVREGEECLVAPYIDKSDRLCATMNVYPYLRTDSTYEKEDRVSGRVYEISPNFGAFVAVDDEFSGLIPQKEMYAEIHVGDMIQARVTEVKADGKLDLSVREKAYLQITQDAQKILEMIDSFDGVLPFNDKVSPEIIKNETGMSKNEFKRAVGNLLKNKEIEITDTTIRKCK